MLFIELEKLVALFYSIFFLVAYGQSVIFWEKPLNSIRMTIRVLNPKRFSKMDRFICFKALLGTHNWSPQIYVPDMKLVHKIK